MFVCCIGIVLCGNPVQALRRRTTRKQQKAISKNIRKNPSPIFTPERSHLSAEEEAMDKEDVFQELKLWRLQNIW